MLNVAGLSGSYIMTLNKYSVAALKTTQVHHRNLGYVGGFIHVCILTKRSLMFRHVGIGLQDAYFGASLSGTLNRICQTV